MPALEWITVEGFKSIRSVERLPLMPLNVLIGPNGSGKSNFVGVFSFLQAILSRRLQESVTRAGGADRILHFGSKVTPSLRIQISFENEVNGYEISLSATDIGSLFVQQETGYFWDKQHYDEPCTTVLPRETATGAEAGVGLQRSGIGKHVGNHLARWRLYHFYDTSATSPIKQTADVNDNRYLRPDGANLAAFLHFLRHKHKESYSLIRRTVQLVTPFFDDFVLEPQALNENKIRLEWRHRGSDAYFDVSSLSDGSLRFIALTTLLLQPVELRPSMIILDEPELGLHPFAITTLTSLIKQVSVETQVVLATQSPLLLDHFRPEDVLVAERVAGQTQFTRLDGATLETWLEDYSLGQLWEKNQFGGRPMREDREDGSAR